MTEKERLEWECYAYQNQPPTGQLSEVELAKDDANTIIFYGSLRKYAEEKEKEQGWLSNWKEHQENEDENTYNSIEKYNNEIIEDYITKIQSELDLIIEQLKKNSSKELISRKLLKLSERFDGHKDCLIDCVEYILFNIENRHLANLGHTDAWLKLDEYLDIQIGKKERAKSKTSALTTPLHLKGNLETLYDALVHRNFIQSNYNIKDFTDCFKGKLINKINPIEFTKEFDGTSRVKLFDELHKKGFIEIKPLKTMDKFLGIPKDYYKTNKSRLKEVNIYDNTESENSVSNLLEIRMIMNSMKNSV